MSQRETWATRASEMMELIRNGATPDDLAIKYGVCVKTITNRLGELRNHPKRAKQDKPVDNVPSNKGTLDRNPDGSYKSEKPLWMTLEQVKDDEYLLKAHGFEPNKWELVSTKHKIWNGYSKQDGIVTLYSSSIHAKPRDSGKTDEEWQKFFETLSSRFRSPVHTPTNYSPNGKLLELNIADLHLGKLAWSGDSGDSYNHEIARERFFYIINDIITRTQTYKFERILFVWCNDFYHFDGPGKTTTAGTPQDASMQYEQMFELGSEMLVQGIDLLNQIAPVMTMYVASNHDRLISFFATKYLAAWYRDNPHVTVDSRALSRKAVRFGVNLVGFTHGHLEKKQMGSWLSVDYRKDWGETLYHEVHAAHVHSEKSIEESNGQITRFVSSPTGTDRWHHDSAYTGAIQKGQSFIWDREMGLEDTKNTTILVKGPMREGVVL
jgi:hypothetical protein